MVGGTVGVGIFLTPAGMARALAAPGLVLLVWAFMGTTALCGALSLGGINLAQRSVRGRDGETGARQAGDIGFAALRGGTVVGDHSVMFIGTGERLEVSHRASSRANFAHGALRAARWVASRKSGLFDMADVLGFTR